MKPIEIKQMFSHNHNSNKPINLLLLYDIMPLINVKLEKDDRDRQHYLYSVTINDVIKSNITVETLQSMKDNGWIAKKDKLSKKF